MKPEDDVDPELTRNSSEFPQSDAGRRRSPKEKGEKRGVPHDPNASIRVWRSTRMVVRGGRREGGGEL